MPSSLKSSFPVLGRILNETPAALYARQRAFVGARLLESKPGRGPGSGTPISAESLATFLIGMLTNASIAENGPVARSMANAVPGGARCPLTGAVTFRDALARVLSDQPISARVNEIRVGLSTGLATIVYDGGERPIDLGPTAKNATFTRGPVTSVFLAGKAKGAGIRFDGSVSADTVHALTKATIKLLAKRDTGDRS